MRFMSSERLYRNTEMISTSIGSKASHADAPLRIPNPPAILLGLFKMVYDFCGGVGESVASFRGQLRRY